MRLYYYFANAEDARSNAQLILILIADLHDSCTHAYVYTRITCGSRMRKYFNATVNLTPTKKLESISIHNQTRESLRKARQGII